MAKEGGVSSSTVSQTETTPWTTSSETETSSIGPNDTNYDIVSLKSEKCGDSLSGRDLTAEEEEWLRMAKEFTQNEKPFKDPSIGRKVVRKLATILPSKNKCSFTILRRKFNGRQDTKSILDNDQITSEA